MKACYDLEHITLLLATHRILSESYICSRRRVSTTLRFTFLLPTK